MRSNAWSQTTKKMCGFLAISQSHADEKERTVDKPKPEFRRRQQHCGGKPVDELEFVLKTTRPDNGIGRTAVKIVHETALPIREISALAIRRSDSGRLQLVAVGDEDFAIVTADCGKDGRPKGTRREELFLPLVGSGIDLRGGSGFEGVAADGDGRVFILQEEHSRLLVFSQDLRKLLHVLALEVPQHSSIAAAWAKDVNEHAEGLLLLRDGHVVVAKQKNPAAFLEFGPENDEPLGVSSATALSDTEPFALPQTEDGRLVALASWALEGERLPTINDIALGADGRVYVISAKGQMIARLEKHLQPTERVKLGKVWKIEGKLPEGDDARPEGLAFVGGATVIGIDCKLAGNNLFILSAPGD